ncbi:MAG TPA: ABC transporter permease [Gammaproteobacteria bacterium]|nr:ABC transporter permease [Gammaproteobacteria bacterium]
MSANGWLRDIRYALRQLARAPGFTAITVLTLSIGIGANTAIFSVVNHLLLRPPAHVVEPERVVTIWTSDFSGPPYGTSSYPDYENFREQRDIMVDVAAYGLVPGNLVERDETVRLAIEEVTTNYFDVLGVLPAQGRLFRGAADDGETVVVLGNALWRSRFGADPAVVGQAVRINGGTFTVVGVAPEGFAGSQRIFGGVGAWVPLETLPGAREGRLAERGSRGLFLLGRLQPGVSLDEALARYTVVANQLLASYPEEWRDVTNRGRAITILPERESRVPPGDRGAVVGFAGLLLAGFALVLLICCVNVANLLLARAAARVRDVAIRVSLGASRARLVRQLMTESVALAALGCAGAVLVTYAATRLLARWQPPGDLKLDVAIDWRVLVFALGAGVVAAAIFGLAPALNLTRLGASSALKEGALAVAGKRRFGMRGALITAQVSVSLVLLVCAGLFLRSLQQAATVDPGFDADNVAIASFDLRTQGYTEARGRAFYAELTERLAGLPNVRAVTLARGVPLSGDGGRRRAVVAGYEPQQGEDMEFNFNVVGPEYFEVMRVPLVRGRGFTAADREGAPQVAVVNETFAARYWPGQNPLGKRLTAFSGAQDIEIVGVARDGKYQTLAEAPLPYIYRPFLQDYEEMTLHVRVARDEDAFLPVLRSEVRAVDDQLPLVRLATMRSETAFATLPQRIAATLLGGCAALALLLAAVGLYGVVAYAVSQRTREIGIRMALGAGRRAVVRMVLEGSMKVVALGLAIGLILALGAGRAAEAFLGDVSFADPIALVAGPLVMSACALVASWLPARRAARIDPMKALREE